MREEALRETLNGPVTEAICVHGVRVIPVPQSGDESPVFLVRFAGHDQDDTQQKIVIKDVLVDLDELVNIAARAFMNTPGMDGL